MTNRRDEKRMIRRPAGRQRITTRRGFLSAMARTGAATALAIPLAVPGRALGLAKAAAPSERITLGGIGIRHRGGYVLNFMLPQRDVQFLAVCDVRADRRKAVKALVDGRYGNQDCGTYRDFRELLARDDIDSVLIATGDHWHALASILSARAGKDVYSEKPCAMTIGQARSLDDTMQRYGAVFQAGTQRRTVENFIFACALARSGKLGKLKALHASIYKLRERHDWLPAQPEPPRDVIDWDLWLGPSPWRPYNKSYVDGGWRGFYDFDSGATLLDWGAHTVDLCQWAKGADHTAPVSYEPLGDNDITCRYADGVKLILRQSGWMGLGTCPVRFEGEDGWIETGDTGRIAVSDPALLADWQNFQGPGISPKNHVRDFFDCVKSRKRPATDSAIMRRSHTACLAAYCAWKFKRKLIFDPDKELFVGNESANQLMRSRAMREPWHV